MILNFYKTRKIKTLYKNLIGQRSFLNFIEIPNSNLRSHGRLY
ncbi:hypothetical protein LEP1GSC033_0512 [Leptospira interrogans str. 2002000632]|nr:hypothetical protein LEP1GSC025_4126 [Leptospira interrogans str. 2002000621]EMJ67938.1 hypothetical protein LEP1GSC033_0512 [Leptospira interrogans str. 2002000632]